MIPGFPAYSESKAVFVDGPYNGQETTIACLDTDGTAPVDYKIMPYGHKVVRYKTRCDVKAKCWLRDAQNRLLLDYVEEGRKHDG